MSKKRDDITKELLTKLYCNTTNSTRDVAKILNCAQSTIRTKLKLYMIASKSIKDDYWKSVKNEKISRSLEKFIIEEELLRAMYWGEDLSAEGIAKFFGCTGANILKKMKEYNIPRRDVKEVNGHRRFDVPTNEIVELYKSGIASTKIAEKYDCSNNVIISKLRNNGIEIRSRNSYLIWNKNLKGIHLNPKTEFKKGMIPWNKYIYGKDSHAWKGGLSFEPYSSDFNERLKERIRKRDNYTCQECGMTQKQLGYRLAIHHIDYNKKNSSKDNLISLCYSCHNQTGYDRNDWTNYFKDRVRK